MAEDKTVKGFASTMEMTDDTPSFPQGQVRLELMKDADKVPGYNSSASNSPDSELQLMTTSDQRPLVEEEKPSKSEQKHSESNLPMASFNVINSIIGSGIIGIPYALREAGIGMGIILLVLLAAMSDYTLNLLVHSGEIAGVNSYQKLLEAGFGKFGFIFVTVVQFLNPLIAMISYNIIAGDTITKIFLRVGGEWLRSSVLSNRQFVVFLFTLLVTLPLSLYRNVAKLGKWSAMSTVFVIIVGAFILLRLITLGPTIPKSDDAWRFAGGRVIQGINIMSTAYVCQHNCFLLYESLVNRSTHRWAIVSHISFTFALITMLVFGLTGYATFTDFTQGDLLENYCYSDDFANVARVLYTFTVVLTYPLECFVTRQVVENLFFADQQPPPLWRHIVFTVAIVAVTVVVSMSTNCLGIVLQIVGALCAAPMSFILPPLAYIKLRSEKLVSWRNILPAAIILFGIMASGGGIVLAVLEIIQGVHCTHGEDMPYCTQADSQLAGYNYTVGNHSHAFNNMVVTMSP